MGWSEFDGRDEKCLPILEWPLYIHCTSPLACNLECCHDVMQQKQKNWLVSFQLILPFYIPACFANEELPLDADGEGILAETFNILTLKEIKLQVISHPPGTATAEEQEEANMTTMAKAVLQAAQNKVVSQVNSDWACLSGTAFFPTSKYNC